jgi:predicted amidohydrolase
MNDHKFAAIQLDTIACEVNHNVHKAMIWTRRAFEEGADYVFLHEGLTADYTPEPVRYGRPLDSTEVFGFCSLAKNYGGYVALGLNEVFEGRPYISMVWCGSEGVIGVYRKSYLWPHVDDLDEWLKEYVPIEQGYRCERGFVAAGGGTIVMQVGELRIGCIICADGGDPLAWETFEKDRPDLIFWQNNRGNVAKDKRAFEMVEKLKTPMVLTNRVGFSYHHFQAGGSVMIAEDGTAIATASQEGEEDMIWCQYRELKGHPTA